MNWTLDGLYDNIKENSKVGVILLGKGLPLKTFIYTIKFKQFKELYTNYSDFVPGLLRYPGFEGTY
jgi:hypothetical protein